MQNEQAKPNELIFIGDTPNDVRCANAIGAPCLIILEGSGYKPEDFAEVKPWKIIDCRLMIPSSWRFCLMKQQAIQEVQMHKNIFKTALILLALSLSSTALAYSNSDLNAVLNGASCPGGDLSGADLSGMDLSGRDFTNTDFTEARLDATKLDKAKLQDACFQSALLPNASLRGANLAYANLRYANASGSDFTNANLQGAYLNRCQLRGAQLLNANLQQVKAQEASMDGVQADYADFSFANLPYSWAAPCQPEKRNFSWR